MKQSLLWMLPGLVPALLMAVDPAPAPASLDALKKDPALSYFSSFDGQETDMKPEAGKGLWNPSKTATYVRASADGTDRALQMAAMLWATAQSVLTETDDTWTMVFSARPGTREKGILLSFGTKEAPGLALRRGPTPGSLAVTVGKNITEPLLQTNTLPDDASDMAWHAYALTYSNGELELFADGVSQGKAAVGEHAVILQEYQWGSRNRGYLAGETNSFDAEAAVRCFGAWKRVLNADEMAAAAMEPQPKQIAGITFNVPAEMNAPTSGYWAELRAGLPEFSNNVLNLEQVTASHMPSQSGRQTHVAEILGSFTDTYADSVYGVESSAAARGPTVQKRDVWLKVSGGKFRLVSGGRDNNYYGNKAAPLEGTLVTEVNGNAKVLYTVGALTGCSNGGDKNHPDGYPFVGDTRVTIDGQAKAVGSVVGRSVASHRRPIKEDVGNSEVCIYSLQNESLSDTASEDYVPPKKMGTLPWNWIVGGTAVSDTVLNGVAQKGDTSVTVVLDEADIKDVENPTFVKNIAGGAFGVNGGPNMVCRIDGKTSVLLQVPDAVTFPGTVMGGSEARGAAGASAVTGDSTVTVRGGTYTGQIYAGGVFRGAEVKGTARLILQGGVFTCGLAAVGPEASAARSELVIDGPAIDLSGAKSLEGFETLTLKGNLTLGSHRLPKALLKTDGEPRTLTLTATDEELAAGYIPVGSVEPGTDLPANLQVSLTNSPEGWAMKIFPDTGDVVYCPPNKANTWKAQALGAEEGLRPVTWQEGFPEFNTLNDVTFGKDSVIGAPGLWLTDSVRAGTVTVEEGADVGMTGPGMLTAVTTKVAGRLNLSPREAPPAEGFPYLRLQLLERRNVSVNSGIGFSEIRLEEDKKLNDIAAITASKKHSKESVVPSNMGDGISNNTNSKWFLNTGHMGAAEKLCYTDVYVDIAGKEGKLLPHVKYCLATADALSRNPKRWSWMGSTDKTTWTILDYRALTDDQAKAMGAFKENWYPLNLCESQTVKGNMEVSGTLAGAGRIEGNVTFLPGGVLELPEGLAASTVTGTVSGEVTLKLPAGWSKGTRRLLTAPESASLTWKLPSEAVAAGMEKPVYMNGAYWLFDSSELNVGATLDLPGTYRFSDLTWGVTNGGRPMTYEQVKQLSGLGLNLEIKLPSGETVLTADDALDAETVSILPKDDLPKDASCTLTLNGRQLRVNGRLLIDGSPTVLAATGSLEAKQIFMKGATLSVDQQDYGTLPRLSGSGTYIKRGEKILSIDAAAEPNGDFAFVVEKGILAMSRGAADEAFLEKAYDITLKDGGKLMIGNHERPNIGMQNAATRLVMEGGSELILHNGAGKDPKYGKVPFDITLRKATQKPACIGGGTGGVNARIEGTITGEAAEDGVQQLKLAMSNSQWKQAWTVAGPITGNLALTVAWPNAVLAGTEPYTYTGGTRFEGKYALSADGVSRLAASDITVADGAVLEVPSTLTVGTGKTLCCMGKVAGSLRFADCAAFDISEKWNMPVLDAGTVAWDGTWLLKVSQAQLEKHRPIVKGDTAVPSVEVWVDGTLSPETTLVKKDNVLVLGTKPADTFPLPPEAGSLTPAVKTSLKNLVASTTGADGTPLSGVSKIVAGETGTVEAAVEALSVFDGVASVAEDPDHPGQAIVSVSYDFSVSNMKFSGGSLYVAAEVRTGSGTPAGYAAGTRCELLAKTDAGEVAVSGQAELEAGERNDLFGAEAPTQGVRYLKFPLESAKSGMLFFVRVTAAGAVNSEQ